MATHSILGLVYLLQDFRARGEAIAPALARHGLDLDHIDPGGQIDRARELRIYTDVAACLRDPLAGLKAGMSFGFAGYGPFTMLLMTCANAYEAFQTGVRYQDLTFLFGRLAFEPGEGVSALVLYPAQLPAKAFRYRIDGEMSGTWKLMSDLQTGLGLKLRPERVDLPYPAPPEARAYEELFGCPVRFGEAQARFWLRNEYLHLRFPTADITAQRIYRAQCEQLLVQAQADSGRLGEQVCAHLELFTETFPAAAAVAVAFGLSERSLRRQLSAEGTSFRALLDQVRYAKARQLLTGTTQSIEAIARQLGYAEAAAFIHAFQRWAGMTPAAYRREKD